LVDGSFYRPDPYVTGTNPCGEITLEPYEACNLGELFLPNIHSMDEFLTAASLMYKVCKSISNVPFSDKKVNKVVERNRRLGIGAGGLLQSRWVQTPEKFGTVYNALEELDISYSKLMGMSTSIKLTTVKPSGTLSLLAGVTPGIHPAYARQYIRRIRFSSGDPLVKRCRESGYHVEPAIKLDGSRDLNTFIVSFPIQVPRSTIIAQNLSVIDQLNFQNMMQEYWSDNSVSITCYYKQNELGQIREYLKQNYTNSIKTVSFLLHSEHGFVQAPYEEITEGQYVELSEKTKPITGLKELEEHTLVDNLECTSGACPVR
jgi:adenosylcobalamin-dependent ribonucleoside-triphosphate reductase